MARRKKVTTAPETRYNRYLRLLHDNWGFDIGTFQHPGGANIFALELEQGRMKFRKKNVRAVRRERRSKVEDFYKKDRIKYEKRAAARQLSEPERRRLALLDRRLDELDLDQRQERARLRSRIRLSPELADKLWEQAIAQETNRFTSLQWERDKIGDWFLHYYYGWTTKEVYTKETGGWEERVAEIEGRGEQIPLGTLLEQARTKSQKRARTKFGHDPEAFRTIRSIRYGK